MRISVESKVNVPEVTRDGVRERVAVRVTKVHLTDLPHGQQYTITSTRRHRCNTVQTLVNDLEHTKPWAAKVEPQWCRIGKSMDLAELSEFFRTQGLDSARVIAALLVD